MDINEFHKNKKIHLAECFFPTPQLDVNIYLDMTQFMAMARYRKQLKMQEVTKRIENLSLNFCNEIIN